MVDILKMGSNSLRSLQHGLSTTGHNIANVNTEGYSRQTVHFASNEPQRFGFGFVGQGAEAVSVERSYNRFLTSQVQNFTASQSRYEAFVGFSARVDNILANSESSLNTSLQKFFSAVADVSANPSALPERQVLVGESENLVNRHQNISRLLQQLNDETNSEMRSSVVEINGLANSIGELNREIVSASSSGRGALPNDLLDERDRVIKQLSQIISVTINEQDDGSINVFVGKGQALVVGSQTTHLQTQRNPFDSSRLEIGVAGQLNVNGRSEFVSGGKLQGLLDFRDRVLLPAQSRLGLIALGMTETVNAQHRLGKDINGDMGGDFFSPLTITAAGNTNNTGTADPVVTITDVTLVRASDYELAYDSANWQLTRLDDGTSVTGPGPLQLDGIDIDVSTGTPVAGDTFIINPGRTAAAEFAVSLSDPRKIAAAYPVIVAEGSNNTGAVALTDLTIDSGSGLPLAGPIQLSFNPDALGLGVPGFDVTGGPGGVLAYDPATESDGKQFTLTGIGVSFQLSGIPQAGDSFEIADNVGSTGDNRNILAIGELQYQSVLNGGQDNYQEFYGAMVADVGVTHRQGETNLTVETSLLQQSQEFRESASGVNLDEEAANLLRLQQAYQASAQLVKLADELFQTLINSVSR